MGSPMIEAHQLAKKFGTFTAVSDVTLEVASGEILALLGPNGAGKTTTVRMLCSLLKPTSGWARICGYDTVEDAPQVRHTVGLLTELPGLYGRMNALEYLDFFGRLQFMDPGEQESSSRCLLMRFGLWDDRFRPVSVYSKGMRQKLALARALLHNPKVILLDEPTSAMDPSSAKIVRDYISELKETGRTIVICTHNLAEAEAIAGRIAVIKKGSIIAQGTLYELQRQLLGPPIFEARFRQWESEIPLSLDGLIQIQDVGHSWIRYQAAQPEKANPLLLRHLVEQGVEVISLRELPQNLETVYLKLVEG